MNPIAYAIPVFFLMIGIELWVAKRRGVAVYRWADALTDLGCGVLQQNLGVFTRVVVAGGYALVYEAGHLLEISMGSPLAWVASFVLVDLAYYWFHRMSHQVHFLWLGHVVHHQSEDYNLAVALRQSAIQPLFSMWFYLPLALLGFPPAMFFLTVSLNTLYQFWIHTELVKKLGPLEAVLNTPSHHRVHHGRNPRYIDKNHAGMFIVWDKLFGTFEPESEPLVYGLTRPVRSWSAVWSNLQPWRDLIDMLGRAQSFGDALRVLVKKPGWLPPGGPEPEEGYWARLDDPKFEVRAPSSYRAYALAVFIPATAALLALLLRPTHPIDAADVALGAFVLASTIVMGGLLEARRWVVMAEASRLVVSLALSLEALRRGAVATPLAAGMLAVVVLSAFGFLVTLRARPGNDEGIAAPERALH